jgi:alpha-tubulin suppressor-like RCC1 family protein
MNPREITKFTDSSSPFIVDIKASECGASFALDETGNLYRWGLNQIEVTPYPIEDRFGTAINFTSNNILYKSPNPYKVG